MNRNYLGSWFKSSRFTGGKSIDLQGDRIREGFSVAASRVVPIPTGSGKAVRSEIMCVRRAARRGTLNVQR